MHVPVSRIVALVPFWLLLRLVSPFLPHRHPMKHLAFARLLAGAKEPAYTIGIFLWASAACWVWVLGYAL